MPRLSATGAVLASVFLVSCLVAVAFTTADKVVPVSPVVKVTLASGGHGSAVYIGGGLFLTANHVVSGDEATIVSQAAKPCSAKATVVWTSTAYDVALISAECEGLAAAPLRCDELHVGERIISYGSPMALDFLQTRGRISGKPRTVGPWKSAYPTDISIGPGMSGGPVMDERGRLVGINVGAAMASFGMGVKSLMGISLIVPATEICRMMGRA